MGNDPRILDWLESVLPVPYDEEPSPRPRKRARPNSDRHRHARTDQKYIVVDGSNRSRLPTPSASCSPTTSRSRAHDDTVGVDPIKLMASKRRRDRTGGLGDGEEQSDLDVTPRGADRSTRYTGFGGSNAFSQQSSSQLSPSKASKASKVSNNSSPTRQIRNAELQDTGFIKASFQSNEQPDSLKSLAETFRKIGDGFGILPRGLYDQLCNEAGVREWMFADNPEFGADRLPDVTTARKILRLADRCSIKTLPESAWNNDVHSRVLDWAFRDGRATDDFVDYRCCTSASIIPDYRPDNAPPKMVDYCICIQPDPNSIQFQATESLCLHRPGQSINHTDWGDLTQYPIGVSIETKGPGTAYDAALVQVATWHAAQWRSIFHGRERQPVSQVSRIPFLPGIIVIKHDWHFVATDRNGIGKARTFESLPLGSTGTMLGLYQLTMSLQKLVEWVRVEYWPAFQADMLGFEDLG